MTTDRVAINDFQTLQRILAGTDALLLDFDGPVCSIFENLHARYVADQLRRLLVERGHRHITTEVEQTNDPFEVFSYAAKIGTDEVRRVEEALSMYEAEAVITAEPTSSAHILISAWNSTGRKLAIVSNNSDTAVNAYLQRHNLTSLVNVVSARSSADPTLLKPSPYLIHQAITTLATQPSMCTLIGDSLTDIHAAHAANTQVIGYANKPEKVHPFRKAHPSAITTTMTAIAEAINWRNKPTN